VYDSRSSHPHKGAHPIRCWTHEDGWFKPQGERTLTKQGAIQEQLIALLDEDMPAQVPGLKRLRNQGYGYLVCERHAIQTHGMARWEAELLQICTEWCQYVWTRSQGLSEAEVKAEEEAEIEAAGLLEASMIDLEVGDTGLPDGTVWSDKSAATFWGDVAVERERLETEERAQYLDEEEADDFEDCWLPVLTMSEAYHELGDGFTIEGPSVTRSEPLKGEHYIRAYELARMIGIEATDLVRHLRLCGEYVKNHMSLVPRPWIEDVEIIRDALIEQYGPRKERPLTWAQERAEWDAKFAKFA